MKFKFKVFDHALTFKFKALNFSLSTQGSKK